MRTRLLSTALQVLCLTQLLSGVAFANTLYVGPSESYTTIQSGIDAASNGDTVIVRDGTYVGPGNKDINFTAKAITVRSENGATAATIDCEGSGRGFWFGSGETAASVVEGFRIANGAVGTADGGAIHCITSAPTISKCIFDGNSARWGGAIKIQVCSPKITQCVFIHNVAVGRGGAIYTSGPSSSPDITNSTFVDNIVTAGDGGAILGWNASANITHCTFSGNSASGKGGAAAFWSGYVSTLTNCVLWSDSAASASEISVEFGGGLVASYSVIGANAGSAYVDAVSSLTLGATILHSDPQFAGAPDYHLAAISPCIDQGNDVGVYIDIDWDARPLGSGFDMGSDEYIPVADIDGDQSPAGEDCDDNDSSVYPGAPELCDGKDNDCDGVIPANEIDADGDGYAPCDGDCDDANPDTNPSAYELPGNAVDENCDGSLGECDPHANWNSHGQFVRCVAHETDALIEAGVLTQEEGDELINSAAQSNVGKK